MIHAHSFWLVLILIAVGLGAVHEAHGQSVTLFGKTANGEKVQQATLKNKNGMVVKIISYGATITDILVPDSEGKSANVVFGFDDVEGYESDRNQYFGCMVGRVANRIAKGTFKLDGKTYKLAINNEPNHLHGGKEKSLAKVIWDMKYADTPAGKAGREVVLTYTSADGEEGYPGKLTATVTYTLSEDNELKIDMQAKTDKATPVNLCNHSYFNLSGAGSYSILEHNLMINADKYTPTDDTLIPTGKIESVANTPLDFRKAKTIGEQVNKLIKTPALGYDHNFVLNRKGKSLQLAAELHDPKSGRVLTVTTTQPGVQLYCGNFLKGQAGRKGETYPLRSAVCLETQHFPDSVNQPGFPSVILQPGETYHHQCVYAFSTK